MMKGRYVGRIPSAERWKALQLHFTCTCILGKSKRRERERERERGRGMGGVKREVGLLGVTNAPSDTLIFKQLQPRGWQASARRQVDGDKTQFIHFYTSRHASWSHKHSSHPVDTELCHFSRCVSELFTVTPLWTRYGRTPALRYGMQIRTLTSAIMWLLA
ncbi:Hypothetical predicted protein [Xyrichtys novacula]|uniref:Uncharacterized protein n=1 Tax=Xyrichtys novacula TaxID=13765 RepID=A0AAV1FLI6_XYRNO|nr:Hypothetical predicted protein [Xyrichtys novacula]